MRLIDWSEAPEGATHYDPNYPDEPWTKLDPKGGWHAFIKGKWQGPHPSDDVWIQEEKWEHLILRPEPTQWQGPQDGLPPVGYTQDDCAVLFLDESEKFEVAAHHKEHAIVVFPETPTKSGVHVSAFMASEFRPIQSERDKAVAEMWYLMDECDRGLSSMAEKLYDAGYRKPMSREEANKALNDAAARAGLKIQSIRLRTEIINAFGYGESQ